MHRCTKTRLYASCTNGKREAQLLWSSALRIASMLCMVECTRFDTELPAAGTASCESFCIRVSVAAGISPYFQMRGLGRCARSLVGRKCLLYARLWLGLLFRPVYYGPVRALRTALSGPSSRERICIRSLRLILIPICTRLSQPIFFGRAARQVSVLSGVWVCCVLFFVVDKLGIFHTILARRGLR